MLVVAVGVAVVAKATVGGVEEALQAQYGQVVDARSPESLGWCCDERGGRERGGGGVSGR